MKKYSKSPFLKRYRSLYLLHGFTRRNLKTKIAITSLASVFAFAIFVSAFTAINSINTKQAEAITPPDSCFAFDATTGTITDYGDEITNPTDPNVANSRNIGTCTTSPDIPGTIGGVAVVAVGDGAFNNTGLISVIIPDSVTSIAGSAFRNNKLTSITIPASVTYLGTHSFRDNSLTSIEIVPSSLSIAGSAFRGNQLTTLPEYFTRPHITSIGDGILRENQFTELVIPDNITSIGSYAFYDNNLTSVTLSNSMKSVGGNYTFAYNQITEIIFPEGFTSIGGSYVFAYNDLQDLTLPNTVTSVGTYSFAGNELETLSLPASLTSIGNSSFANNKLTSVVIPTIPTTVQHNSFTGNLISSISLAGTAYNDNSPTTDPACFVITGGAVTEYYRNSLLILRNNSVFCGGNIVIPNSATSIADQALQGKQLFSATIPNTVNSIGNSAFRNNQLTSVVIPGSTNTIGNQAFENNQITSIVIPDSVSSLGSSAFRSNSLESVKLSDSNITMGAYAFANNSITELDLGSALDYISDYAFSNNSLEAVTIPNTVLSIGSSAFYNNKVASLSLGESVTSIGASSFGYNNLEHVIMPNSITSIGSRAFSDNNLNKVVIPDGVTSIGSSAFYDNSLESIIIPDSVTELGSYAFSENLISNVNLGRGLTRIEDGVFHANKISEILLPKNITTVEPTAFFEQNPWGGSMYNPSSSPYRWSDDAEAIQTIFDSIWYVKVYTEDPTNPNGILPSVVDEYYWSWESNNNGENDSLGGHVVNPTTLTIKFVDASGQELETSSKRTGVDEDTLFFDYKASTGPSIPFPNNLHSPTPAEQTAIEEGFASYYQIGQTISVSPLKIDGYLTPSSVTKTLTADEINLTFVYQRPPAPSVTSSTSNTIDLSWQPVESAVNHTLQFRAKGSTKWKTISIDNPDTTNYTLTGLTADTDYEILIITTLQDDSTVQGLVLSASTEVGGSAEDTLANTGTQLAIASIVSLVLVVSALILTRNKRVIYSIYK